MQSEIRLRDCLRIVCVALVIVIVTVANCFATDLINSFKSFNHQGPASWHFSASFGSFYDTSKRDFVVPGKFSLHIYQNAGYGAFYLADSLDWGTEALTTVDLNNDGYTDIVAKGYDAALAGSGDYRIFVKDSSGPGIFSAHHCTVDLINGSLFSSAFGKCADLTGDGYPDCAHWIYDGTIVGLMNFDPVNDSLVPNPDTNGARFIKTACTDGCSDGTLIDLDGDGDLDIVTANGQFVDTVNTVDPVWVSVFTNDGSGLFSRAYDIDPDSSISTDTWALRITSGQMNADSYPDVVVGRQECYATDSLIFYKGSSNGILTYDTAIAFESITWLTTADVDGDSHVDIVAAADDSIVVFYNDGSRHFSKETVKPVGASFGQVWHVACSDVDGDGDTDLLVSDKDGGKTWVCYNHDVADTAGDCNDDDVIDIYDFLFLYDYLYSSGDAPTPWYAGDCNFDGSTDADDLSYIIDYLFSSGPLPFVH